MNWKQELLWVKRNEHGVALRIEEERPESVPVEELVNDSEEVDLTITPLDSLAAFASLNRYFARIQTSKPTLKQAEDAIDCLCQIYGAANEEILLERGDPELIETYKQLKNEIMMKVNE